MDASVVDLSPILHPLWQITTVVVLGVAPLLTNKALNVVQKYLHVQFTSQQIQAVHDATDTAAGVINTMLTRGEMHLDDVHITNDTVRSLTRTAMQAVPTAVAATGVDAPYVAHMIVGRVGKLLSADPTVETLPPVAHVDNGAAPVLIPAPVVSA